MPTIKMNCKKFSILCSLVLLSLLTYAQTDPLDTFFNESSAALLRSDYQQALLSLQKVRDKDPNNTRALQESALVYDKLKNYKQASVNYKQLTQLQPGNSNYYTGTGWYLMLNKEYAESEKYCLKALSMNDCSYANYLNLGHLYGFLKQFTKCQEYYKKAVSYIPNREAYEQSILADFALLEAAGNFPYKIAPFKKMFETYFTNEYLPKQYGSKILDSIYGLTSFENYATNDETIIAMKERFLKEEYRNEHQRYYVLRDFYWSLGWIHFNRDSKTIAMQEYFLNAVEISNDLKDTSFTIEALYEVGDRNEGGDFLIMQALDLAVLSNNFDKQYLINLGLGDKMSERGKQDSALYYFRKSFYLSDRSEEPRAKEFAINRLILIFGNKRQIDSVRYYYALAKKINTGESAKLENGFQNDLNYCNLLRKLGKTAEAISKGKEFINLYKNEKSINVSDMYERVGLAYSDLSRTNDAVFYFKEAIRLNVIYIENNPRIQHEFPLKERLLSFEYLKRMALQKNNIKELFDLSEQTKANMLYPTLTGKYYPPKSISMDQVAKGLQEDELVISYCNSSITNKACAIGISKNAQLLVKEDHVLLDSLIKKHEEVNWNEALSLGMAAMTTLKSEEDPEELRTTAKILSIIANNLNNMMLGGSIRGIILANQHKKSNNINAEMLAYNDVMYRLYIKPFEKLLAGTSTIYLSPDLGSALIPFEALKNEQGQYLGDLYNIIYVPSFTSSAILKAKQKNDTKKMLALGNPVYTRFKPGNTRGRAYDLSVNGLNNWSDLPGTDKELNSIQKDVPDAIIIDRNNLSESKLKALSNSGELAQFDILHFAVHGLASLNNYRDNCLVISETGGTAEDGILQFDEITHLNLKAKLVCLSACETAAGLPAEGEDVKNLPVAFFIAGAEAVIATWWKIDDEATGLFMSSFYNLVFKENISYSSALQLTRKKFINGTYGEKYKAPYYWAAFKYFGH